MVEIKEIESYKDFGKCTVISNGVIEAYVTTDIGPRIIRFGFVGGQNIMHDDRTALGGRTCEKFEEFFGSGRKWENFGGHRIWLSPEKYPESYTPDDKPLEVIKTDCGARFAAPIDEELGIRRIMELKMDEKSADLDVTLYVENHSGKPMEFAIWALTVCASDSQLIIPMNTDDTELLHNRNISVWPYTDLSDKRIRFGKKYAYLKQIPGSETNIKLGFDSKKGVGYLCLGDDVFCKKYKTNHPAGNYPDNNCSFEAFTNETMLEFESLSELKKIAPGEAHTHTEHWSLYKKPCELDITNDDSTEKFIAALI